MPFRNDSDPELIAKSAAVVQAYTPEFHAYLLSLFPTPESVQANHNSLTTSYAAHLAGDTEKGKEWESHRLAVYQSLSILSGLAKAVTVKDPKVPEVLGVGSVPTRSTAASATLSQPTGFKVVFDPAGHLVGSATKVTSAKGYEIWACDSDPNLESNWRLIASSPSCRGIIVPGLDRGKSNWLRIRAMRGRGEVSPWSNFVNVSPT